MVSQAERRTRTRSAIIDAATHRFADNGYASTSIEDILTDAGVSRGALYHHFDSKEEVFAAVFLATSSTAIRAAVETVPEEGGALETLIAGCIGWLQAVRDPGVARILLVDGVHTLGWQRARALEEATSLGVIRAALQRAIDDGQLPELDTSRGARLINALLAEAALHDQAAGTAPDVDPAVKRMITSMIDGLRNL